MRFLVKSGLNQQPTPDILALIPAETARGKELDTQGIRLALYVAADMSFAWQVLQSDSLGGVEAILTTLPLRPYMDVEITQLADDTP